ncbi:MAG: DNA topoisomerase, partial [Opitutae bacterium]|nr:DNA topoisomerase [Opitutae bacterium]
MADQNKDSEQDKEEETHTEDGSSAEKQITVRRFDPEALLSDDGADREGDDAIYVDDMYGDWFLDYASYVILERAVPHADDGLKPVQRRILHSMRELEDGRYNKVANVIGNTMKYHPHGDASIGDAMIQL